ncbi:hypothetical protein EJ06DRAFT_528461 [Trichodelitschia bisporula]|uniref:PHD-type domain-containing protein n=1 Tax=Trichodelitschia bisporula TaxID=703511 RepID=A0A6G1I2Q1_9PEZI|nr:hypothetical protein EJ06DRAFT_528461 [Trichodelitschia bisporula]
MPAVRQTRKSYAANASPAPGNGDPPPRREHRQTNLDAWIEPQPRTPVPSFEDNGLERGGVLATMAPLGAPPPQKLKIKMSSAARGKKNGVPHVAAPSGDDTDMTPPVEADTSTGQSPKITEPEVEMGREPLPMIRGRLDDDDDEEYTPNGHGSATKPSKYPTRNGVTMSSTHSRRTSSVRGTPAQNKTVSVSVRPSSRRGGLEEIINAAVERSHREGQPNLGQAVQRLYIESQTDPKIYDLLNAILLQTATEELTTEFQRHIRRVKKEIKAEETAAKRASGKSSPAQHNAYTNTRNSGSGSGHTSTGKPPLYNSSKPASSPNHYSSAHRQSRDRVEYSHSKTASTRAQQRNKSVDEDESIAVRPDTSSRDNASKPRQTELPPDDDSSSSLSDVDYDIINGGTPTRSSGRNAISGEDKRSHSKKSKSKAKLPVRRTATDAELSDREDDAKRVRQSLDQTKFNHASLVVKESFVRSPPRSTPRDNELLRSMKSTRSAASADVVASAPAMRPGTPTGDGRPRRRAAGPRTKTSPVKPARQTELNSSSRNTPAAIWGLDEDQHRDECHACGTGGQLVCCGTCPKVYHPECFDPPVTEAQIDDPYWTFYCFDCQFERRYVKTETNTTGIFGPLLARVSDHAPRIFALPKEIKETYQSVNEDADGNYLDTSEPLITVKDRNPAHPDIVDASKVLKEASVMCVNCAGTAMGGRDIIQCDDCKSFWHTDCLDPPMAGRPQIIETHEAGKRGVVLKRQFFRCPRHVSKDMRLYMNSSVKLDPHTKRGHKIRKYRNPKEVHPALQRGVKHNGHVRVEVESDDEGDTESFEPERDADNTIYVVKERAIVADFMGKLQRRQLGHPFERVQSYEEALGLLPQNIAEKVQTLVARKADEEARLNTEAYIQKFRTCYVHKEQEAMSKLATLPKDSLDGALALTEFAKQKDPSVLPSLDAANIEILLKAAASCDPKPLLELPPEDFMALQKLFNLASLMQVKLRAGTADSSSVSSNADASNIDVAGSTSTKDPGAADKVGDGANVTLDAKPTEAQLEENDDNPDAMDPSV